MPFYYVQIAPHKYKDSRDTGAALLREAQMEALKTIPNSGMVPTTDIGDEFCIHPPQKDVVGLLYQSKQPGHNNLKKWNPFQQSVSYPLGRLRACGTALSSDSASRNPAKK